MTQPPTPDDPIHAAILPLLETIPEFDRANPECLVIVGAVTHALQPEAIVLALKRAHGLGITKVVDYLLVALDLHNPTAGLLARALYGTPKAES